MRQFVIFSILLLPIQIVHADTGTIFYPRYQDDTRFIDIVELLNGALEKTTKEFGGYQLMASPQQMTENRQQQALEAEQGIHLMWMSTSPDKETRFKAIQIPLRKGLLGYRISLIHNEEQSKIDRLSSMKDLLKIQIGQGIGWGDVSIYRYSRIKVFQAPYKALFRMLNSKRFDIFPRGINEVFDEYSQQKEDNPNITIESNLLLYYPWPYYIFTSKKNPLLHQRIETGFNQMIKDGSFDRIFMKHHADAIQKARFDQRRVIQIPNPYLPSNTPLDRTELWFQVK
ncbi:type 2 periplasmic-binding domain-containing protein [Algicola sagamiensis]|uniref:hypothetical protein n=1 Tax=Algicola sagamiensis TaxID=163869 RepID=UPI0003811922|nr:hypothetical protein [Algicola sagamiensis]